jgi:acyl-homoserine lactone acylase PvdQ
VLTQDEVIDAFYGQFIRKLAAQATRSPEMMSGILLTDNWWVNGRNRSLSACALVEADPASKTLPSPPAAVAAVLTQCGKARRTVQAPLLSATSAAVVGPVPAVRTPMGGLVASANPEAARAVQAITADYRARLQEIVERAAPPHDLPPAMEVLRESLGVTSGPMKPFLERTFKPMGYSCRGESGTFTLRRRTQANLTAQLYLDVGTWSHQVTAIFQVLGVGFKASLPIPVAFRALDGMQYPIGDAERWQNYLTQNAPRFDTVAEAAFAN